MSKYLDPKADVVFKKIFGENPSLLKSFLNAVLPLPADHPIVELSYLTTEQIPKIPTFRRTIVDVKCTDSSGWVFIVEMQIDWNEGFKQRLLLGASHAMVLQLEAGHPYKLLQPVYGLGIMGDIFDKESSDWYHHYQLVKQEPPEPWDGETNSPADVIEHLQLVFVELPKFPVHSSEEKQLRLLWLRFLREINGKTVDVSQELLDVPEISHAVRLAEEAAYTPAELHVYEGYWKEVSSYRTMYIERYDTGRVEGKVEGKAEGLAEGVAKGKANAQEEIAKKLLKRGTALGIVVEDTGLSYEEVEAIQAAMDV